MKRPHYVKGVRTTSTPRVLVSIAHDPIDTKSSGHGYTTRAASWSIRISRRRENEWRPLERLNAKSISGNELLRLLTELGPTLGRLYVVTLSPTDTLTMLGAWSLIDTGSWSLRTTRRVGNTTDSSKSGRRPHPLVLSTAPEVVGWSIGAAEFRAVSLYNHLPMSILESAKWAGMPDPPAVYTEGRPAGHVHPDSAWTADALQLIYQRLFAVWTDAGAGRWADTIGAAAWSWWRTTIGDHKVLQHEHESAKAVENAAVHGGRVQTFYFGAVGDVPTAPTGGAAVRPGTDRRIDGPVFKLDVRSMYATILRDGTFPVKLSHKIRCKDAKQLELASRDMCALATVRVRLESPRLPYRGQYGRIVYPVGEWWTTLSTPELRVALGKGEVKEIGECWLYHPGNPFADFSSQLLALRERCKSAGDNVGGTFAKLIANALGGRLAKTGKGWVTDSKGICRQRWGVWHEVDVTAAADDGHGLGEAGAPTDGRPRLATSLVTCRGIAGVRQTHKVTADRPGGLTAIYAHLTAYGRCRMARLLDLAGPGGALWCDTDGLIVTRQGLDGIVAGGETIGTEPGQLRIESEYQTFRARTPKHYCADSKWTLAGFRDDYGVIDGGNVIRYQTVNPVRAGQYPDGEALDTAGTTFRLDSIPLSGTPGADGWLLPPVVNGGSLIQPRDDLPDELLNWDY